LLATDLVRGWCGINILNLTKNESEVKKRTAYMRN
jgi:hypothetical protein